MMADPHNSFAPAPPDFICSIPCQSPGCQHWFYNNSSLTKHMQAKHQFSHCHGLSIRISHLVTPCNETGEYLPQGTPPSPPPIRSPNDWAPYHNCVDFELMEFLYKKVQMLGKSIDTLSQLWCASLINHGIHPNDINLFKWNNSLLVTIDTTPVGDMPWEGFSMSYDGPRPLDAPEWMTTTHNVWFHDPQQLVHNLLTNWDFDGEFDYMLFQEFDTQKRQCWWDFMSGNWAWKEANIIANDPDTHGLLLVPIILGSDKTTVSVATGQNDNIHNNVHRAHQNAVVLLGLLAIPKTDKRHTDNCEYHRFCHQLFHSSLTNILSSLRPTMTIPEVAWTPDSHSHRIIYSSGPYIADYLEQALLACVVQGWCPQYAASICAICTTQSEGLISGECRSRELTNVLVNAVELDTLWYQYGIVANVMPFTSEFPWADLHEIIAPDILHQVIKGTFKDHLVLWVKLYLVCMHGKSKASTILDDIDHHIALAPSFLGLRHFPQGCSFKQWTGDNLKALMKVNFCYLVHQDMFDEDTLVLIQDALDHFNLYQDIFLDIGARPHRFSLPQQHLLCHYRHLICLFGAPNGHCTSITKSMHEEYIKGPWQKSNKCHADAHTAHSDFKAQGMLKNMRKYPLMAQELADMFCQPNFHHLIQQFLYDQSHLPDPDTPLGMDVPLAQCPPFYSHISVYHTMTAIFYSPSDPSGLQGMHQECIQSNPCLDIMQLIALFSFVWIGVLYPCALVQWFTYIVDKPDEVMGLWVVQPDYNANVLWSVRPTPDLGSTRNDEVT
ncbi:hypothetical protein EI94DRAFT_1771196 [Lactarius quietus]|nr:hypothetical protein EI94DRAFT_1771196 [Lactarius quietus]